MFVRFLAVFSITAVFLCLFISTGCRLMDPGGDTPQISASITGVIFEPEAVANQVLSLSTAAAAKSKPLANTQVWIEEYPEYTAQTDENGSYTIVIPFIADNLHVVARIARPGTIWKNRSSQPLVFNNGVANFDMPLAVADHIVTGRLYYSDGTPLEQGIPLYLWGELFHTDAGGWFRSLPLPDSFRFGEIVFRGNGNARAFRLLAPFVAADYPAYIETRLPAIGGAENNPPQVYLTATRNGTPVTMVNNGQEVVIIAVASDEDQADKGKLTAKWSASRGTITESGDPFAITWTAPETSGLATVSILVQDTGNGAATCSMPIVVNVAQQIDETAPEVSQVSAVQADGNYIPGQTIDVTVQFNEVVKVTGTPRLKLETGDTDRYAIYLSGTNSNTLTFRYVVQNGDLNPDLDYTGTNALELNSGTIKDAAGNPANLTLAAPGATGSLGASKALKIGAPPSPKVAQVNAVQTDGNYIPGQNIDVTVQFDKVVKVTGTPRLKMEAGTTDRYATYLSGTDSNTLTFRYVVQNGDLNLDLDYTDTNALELNDGTIKDADGTSADLTLAAPGAAGSLGASKALKVGTPPTAQVTAGTPANPSGTVLYSITVGGANVVAYKYNLDNANSGAFSAETAIANPITGSLPDGQHALKIIGRDANGFWQSEANATIVTWTVRSNTYVFNRRIGNTWSLTASGQVNEAADVTVDGDGNIYVVDRVNCRIQKFNNSGVFIKEWGSEGTGDTQFRWPRGIAYDGTYLWVADTSNQRIIKFNTEGVYQEKWATAADDPIGIACANGKIYVGQRGANITVVAYNTSGVVQHTSATFPNGMAETATPQDVAVDADGNVFMSGENGKIYKMPEDLSSVDTVYNSNIDGGYVPKGIGISGSGALQYLYVAFSDHTIRKIKTSDGSRVATYGKQSSAPGDFTSPAGVLVIGSSFLVAEQYRVQKLALADGSSEAIFANEIQANGSLWYPQALSFDAAGNLYVTDTNNSRVQSFSMAGAFITKWGNAGTDDGKGRPRGIAVDSSGNVYVSDQENDRIQKFSSTGDFMAKWGVSGAGDGEFSNPESITIDADGNLHIVDSNTHRLQIFTAAGAFIRKIGTAGAGDGQLSEPMFSAVDSAGNIYVSDTENRRVQKFSATGDYLSQWSTTGRPSGIAVDAGGNVYVADFTNQILRKFDSAGNAICTIGTGSGSGDGQLNRPLGLALDQAGNVFVIDSNNNRVQVFSPQ